MSEVDQLMQRFLDQELSGEERVRFLARIGRDEALRSRLIELEELLLHASRLPRPVVPETFVADVMRRTESTPALWRKLANVVLAPRVLRWNLASAGALASLVVVTAWGAFTVARFSSAESASPSVSSAAPPGRNEAIGALTSAGGPVVLVRFVVLQPGANTVQIAGDFNGWDPTRTPLDHTGNGAWTVTLPLSPGRYEYKFVVDGQQWILDPFAAEQHDDGFGSRNAVVDVRTPASIAVRGL
jgi:hypothetical protein